MLNEENLGTAVLTQITHNYGLTIHNTLNCLWLAINCVLPQHKVIVCG
jgi:hypothetical protein